MNKGVRGPRRLRFMDPDLRRDDSWGSSPLRAWLQGLRRNPNPLSRFVSPVRQRWPSRLWLVRHGQSAGNVARAAAVAAGEHLIGLEVRDMDVPLSDLGLDQAAALGRWFASRPEAERPAAVISSPYLR